MFVCSLRKTKSKENNNVGNWVEKCSNLPSDFNSLVPHHRCRRTHDDATLFPFLSGMSGVTVYRVPCDILMCSKLEYGTVSERQRSLKGFTMEIIPV